MNPEVQPSNQPRWGRWITAALTATALVATTCSGPSSSGGRAVTPGSARAHTHR